MTGVKRLRESSSDRPITLLLIQQFLIEGVSSAGLGTFLQFSSESTKILKI